MKTVKIITIEKATHNVMHIKTEKPEGISFKPGQAADVSLTKEGWEDEKRPFTFTSLPEDDFLEFFIKVYPKHDGVTEQIGKLKKGDSFKVGDVFGEIENKGEGIFIAGGAGITPFIAILKKLAQENKLAGKKLIFANKTHKDIIAKDFFDNLLGSNFINVLSEEKKAGFEHGFISKDIIEKHTQNTGNYFYVCGPPPMMDAVLKILRKLGVDDDKIINEEY